MENFFEGRARMKSSIVKRSVVIEGHKTSVSLEDQFWSALKEIAHARQMTLSKLISKIDEAGNLSSAIRLFVLDQVRINGMSHSSGGPNVSLVPPCAQHQKKAEFIEA
jgi:predicted DNA-binding ribbon-helix-helix protein